MITEEKKKELNDELVDKLNYVLSKIVNKEPFEYAMIFSFCENDETKETLECEIHLRGPQKVQKEMVKRLVQSFKDELSEELGLH